MKYLPTHTLAYHNAAPQTHVHDLSALPTGVLASATKLYKNTAAKSTVTNDAVTFYTLNHCASIVRKQFTVNEPLPEWAQKIMKAYTDACISQGERMLHYILLVTTREMRHLKMQGHPSEAFWIAVKTLFGEPARKVLDQISNHSGEEQAMLQYLNFSADLSLGTYVKALSYGFHKAEGWSGPVQSHGGPKWGNVVDAVVAMIHGKTSMEMLVDTGYTLAHNGGPIFNKGHLYNTQNAQQLITILDVQRSGQLPDLMQASDAQGVHRTTEAMEAVSLIQEHCSHDVNDRPTLKGYVDWKLVNELRTPQEKHENPHKYDAVIAKQVQPMAKKVKVVEVPEAPKVVVPTTVAWQGKAVKVVGEWAVFPHQKIKIVERLEKE